MTPNETWFEALLPVPLAYALDRIAKNYLALDDDQAREDYLTILSGCV